MKLLERMKWFIARKEMEELEQWNLWCHEYHKWLSHEFPDVGKTLDSLHYWVKGSTITTGNDGRPHWGGLNALRENLRVSKRERNIDV